jgi:hypothetical protein
MTCIGGNISHDGYDVVVVVVYEKYFMHVPSIKYNYNQEGMFLYYWMSLNYLFINEYQQMINIFQP